MSMFGRGFRNNYPPIEAYSQQQVKEVKDEVMTALRDNPNGEVQVKVRYFDKDARSWVSRQGNVTAHNNQLYFHGTDGASNDADEDPIEWPVMGGTIICREVTRFA